MKHVLCVGLFLITIGNNRSNAQCLNPSSYNGSLNFSSSATSIPNDMAPTGWDKVSTPDQAKTGLQIDCTTLPLVASTNGGSWTRMADKVTIQEAISNDISGLTPGTSYEVTFEQSLVKNWARSSGNVSVTIGATTRHSVTIALPSAGAAQTSWQSVTVGPFLATSSTMTLTLAAHSNQDGTGSSPMPGSCSGYTQNALAADLMIDGIVVCPIASLPLNFLSFAITDEKDVHTLTWNITDMENELEKFVVTQSKDLSIWNAVGNLEQKHPDGNYSFPIEQNFSASEIYYKVTAYDKNNFPIASSPVISDKANQTDTAFEWTYNNETNLLTSSSSNKDRSVILYTMMGNKAGEYFSKAFSVPEINMLSFPEGGYLLHTSNGARTSTFRFIK